MPPEAGSSRNLRGVTFYRWQATEGLANTPTTLGLSRISALGPPSAAEPWGDLGRSDGASTPGCEHAPYTLTLSRGSDARQSRSQNLSFADQNGSRLRSLGMVIGEKREICFPVLKDPRSPPNA